MDIVCPKGEECAEFVGRRLELGATFGNEGRTKLLKDFVGSKLGGSLFLDDVEVVVSNKGSSNKTDAFWLLSIRIAL